MEQTKQAVAIIKNRWQEVVLVLGLYVTGSLAAALVSQPLFAAMKAQQTGQDAEIQSRLFFFVIFSAIVTVFSFFLYIGFVRTAYTNGSEQQQPGVLLKEGKKFFWRIFGFFLLYGLALIFVPLTLLMIIKGFSHLPKDQGMDLEIVRICTFAVMVLLMKPAILIPALIIVLDCGIIKSLDYLKDVKLRDAKGLIVLFLMQAVILLIFPFSDTDKTTSYYVLGIIPKTMVNFIRLLILIIAVRFVSLYDLKYEPSGVQMAIKDLSEE